MHAPGIARYGRTQAAMGDRSVYEQARRMQMRSSSVPGAALPHPNGGRDRRFATFAVLAFVPCAALPTMLISVHLLLAFSLHLAAPVRPLRLAFLNCASSPPSSSFAGSSPWQGRSWSGVLAACGASPVLVGSM